MSLHRNRGDIEEGEGFSVSSSSDVQHHSRIELVEYPFHNNSRSSSSTMIAAHPKESNFKKKLYEKLWPRVRSLFAGWWVRIKSSSVGWWIRVVDWWAKGVTVFVDWWMGELLAILLSIVAFFAIILVLRKYDGHNIPTLPHNIPLNFVVSTLATVSKSLLLFAVASALGQFKWLWMFFKQRRLQDLQIFDDASRGPLGASRLLASKKILSWASIGAVVTILSLIYDPFIQALIKVSERVIYKDNPASIVHKLDMYPHYESDLLQADYLFINTINNAAFNPNPLSESQPRCPTGNCTWPPFTSLGFCFKCENISQSLQDSSSYIDSPGLEGPESFTRNYTYKFPELNGQVLRTVSDTLPGQPFFRTTFDKMLGLDPIFFVFQLGWDAVTPFNFTDGTSVPTISLLILIRPSTEKSNPGDILAADLCALSFCAQKRNVSVSLNQLSSTVLQTVYGAKNVQSKPEGNFPSTENDLSKGLSFTGDDFNITFSEMPDGGIDAFAWTITLQQLVRELEGSLDGMPTLDRAVRFNVIGAFYASSNISMTMNNIATAMTNYFRDSSNATITGQAGQTELFVHVNWPWITLPAFLVLAGTFFLILAMLETKRLGANIWKTSELALLFHGSEDGYRDLNNLNQSSEMEHVASGIKAKMTRTSDGVCVWFFLFLFCCFETIVSMLYSLNIKSTSPLPYEGDVNIDP